MNIFTVSLLQVDSINVNYNNSRTHNLSRWKYAFNSESHINPRLVSWGCVVVRIAKKGKFFAEQNLNQRG